MAWKVLWKQWVAIILVCVILGWLSGCGSGGGESSGTVSGSESYPGACVCYFGSGTFDSCIVTADLATCRQTVTTCNPFFYTNSDCSAWCPATPEVCY
ncbi:MAG: hypothetical protein HY807_08995 [Nitrospirae bacterium]|nr:hypothetical protein [Nitrospirota bacterium]